MNRLIGNYMEVDEIDIHIEHKGLHSWILKESLPWKLPRTLTIIEIRDPETGHIFHCKALPWKMHKGDTLHPIQVPIKKITFAGNEE